MKKFLRNIILFFSITILQHNTNLFTQKKDKYLIVTDIVANIRAQPIDATTSYIKDILQETQVLYNEILKYKDEIPDWYYVECIEQPEFTHNNKWEGYPGWIRKKCVREVEEIVDYDTVVKNSTAKIFSSSSDTAKILFSVSIGTKFKIYGEQNGFYKIKLADGRFGWIKKDDVNIKNKIYLDKIRHQIISTAMHFLGVPYLWGGRCMLMSEVHQKLNLVTGVDCSGFVNLVFRANHIILPRDAHEQWMVTERITNIKDLQPADLIFLAKKEKPESIGHVMIYVNEEMLIESDTTLEGNGVKMTTYQKKFGVTLPELASRDFYTTNGQKVYFGRVKDLKR